MLNGGFHTLRRELDEQRPTHNLSLIMQTTLSPVHGFFLAAVLATITPGHGGAQPNLTRPSHDRTQPSPPVVTPGTSSTPTQPGRPPSDAIVLFDGTDLSQWVSQDGSSAPWKVRDGYMECVGGTGYLRTLRNFGDCQLHVEWAAPVPAEGVGQGRGNSGVFFGMTRYEVQVLDSYQNNTYADGSAGSLYGQHPPLVNACRPPGEWQTYDILYTAPRFAADGALQSPARFTVFHNGVLIQHNAELTGPTDWIDRAPYAPHAEKQPLALQDHRNPVRFRNIWVRELGPAGKPEFTFADRLLDSYTGTFGSLEIAREGHQLTAKVGGKKLWLFAESPTRFFAKTTDVQIEFKPDADGKVNELVWSVGEGANVAKRTR